MEMTVSESAARRITELVKGRPDDSAKLRVSVDSGGCSGFSYKYEFVQNSEEGDYVLSADGVTILVDPISQKYLNGSRLDFVEELGKSYFEIKNPNSKSSCGCGNSFSVD